MDNSKQSKQILLSVIGVAILVVAVVGVSFAFFNYTRTGAANTVSTGKIKFVSSQTEAMNLQNKFPLTAAQYSTQTAAGYTGNVDYGEVTVTIKGETTYASGLDFRVSAVDVHNSATVAGQGTITLPINVDVTTTMTHASPLTNDRIAEHDFTTGTNVLAEGSVLADGHIDATADAANFTANGDRYQATVVVRAYLDGTRIAITDTSTNPADPHVDEGTTNGTTSGQTGEETNWVAGRTVLTTDQWNSLSSSASNNLSFKIRVESKETGGSYVGE